MLEMNQELFLSSRETSASRKWIEGDHNIHWHDFYEIEYILSGSGSYMINGQSFEVQEGMLYFMTPIDFHHVNTGRTELFNVMFSGNVVSYDQLVTFTHHTAPKAIYIPPTIRPWIISLLTEIVECQKEEIYTSMLLTCLLMKLSRSLMNCTEKGQSGVARKMQFYIINHFREKVTLEDVARYAGLTPAYASAVFKKEMATNFKRYLNNLRFSYAKNLLTCSDMSVTQICGECGFEDYPNFIRRFKKHFGMTPSDMRGSSINR